MRSTSGAAMEAIWAGAFLMLIILFGEIGPKVVANSNRARFALLTAPLLVPLHEVIAPVRVVLADGVIAPLRRLVAPHRAPAELDDQELQALLGISRDEGVIASEEERILGEVLRMGKLRVPDVMTPRIRMVALPDDADRTEVLRVVRESKLSQIPVYEGRLDHVVGMLHVKRYLTLGTETGVTDPRVLTAAGFVPALASLDQLLDHFRRRGQQSAIVVDEFGGTEGIVSVEDVVEELVGDIVAADEEPPTPPRLIGLGVWRVSGRLGVHDWMEAFDVEIESPKASTVAGLLAERLGRVPRKGDIIAFGAVHVEVEQVDRRVVVSALVRITQDPEPAQQAGEESP
jgi:putative hemolysin